MGATTYKIIRMFFASEKKSRVVKRHLTLREAQAHCRDPKTHHRKGPPNTWWFDGYEEE